MLVIGRRLPTVSGSQAMLRRSRTAPYHVGRGVLSSSSGLQGVLRGALHGLARPACTACTARAAGVVCVVLEALDRSAGSRLRGHEESAVCAGCNGCSLPLSVERGCAGVRALEPVSPACMRTSWISVSAAFGFTLRMFHASASIIPPLTIVCFVAALTLPPSAHSKQRCA